MKNAKIEKILIKYVNNRFRLSFDKTNGKCGDNLQGEAFVRIYFEELNTKKINNWNACKF